MNTHSSVFYNDDDDEDNDNDDINKMLLLKPRVVTSEYAQRLYLLLLHCFKQWPMETSFRAVSAHLSSTLDLHLVCL